MVVAGYNMIRGIFADSAAVFRYDEAYGLDQDEVHFPTKGEWDESLGREGIGTRRWYSIPPLSRSRSLSRNKRLSHLKREVELQTV